MTLQYSEKSQEEDTDQAAHEETELIGNNHLHFGKDEVRSVTGSGKLEVRVQVPE